MAEKDQAGNDRKDDLLFGKEGLFKRALYELRGTNGRHERQPVDADLLGHVRDIEQQSSLVGGPAALAAAGGDDIERLAVLDKLTELLNTRSFLKELKDEIARSRRYKRPVSLCVISVDNHAELKEHFGPLTAEAVMRVVAGVVRAMVRENDLPAVYGEHEIMIIFPETLTATAAILAEKIRDHISTQAITHNWEQLRITASIGLATFPSHASEHDELIARALQALSVAQQRGGDRVCCV